jgi:F-type H+-transporting ATPase subunit delta
LSSEHPVSGVASRYATALFELADEAGSLDAVADDLRQIRDMLNGSEDLVQLVRSPAYGAEDQARAFNSVLSAAGVSALVSNFTGLVIRNRRLFLLADMISAYLAQLAAKRGGSFSRCDLGARPHGGAGRVHQSGS